MREEGGGMKGFLGSKNRCFRLAMAGPDDRKVQQFKG